MPQPPLSGPSLSRRAVLAGGVAGGAALGLGMSTGPAYAAERQVRTHLWEGPRGFARGGNASVRFNPRHGLRLNRPAGVTDYTDPHTGITRSYEFGTWLTPVTAVGFGLNELVASWNATTPAGTFVRVEAQGHTADGRTSPWYLLANWASGDGAGDIRRTSLDGQADPLARVWTDTVATRSGITFTSYQLRVTLLRQVGSDELPSISLLAAMASAVPSGAVAPSAPTRGLGHVLDVPTYSQETHVGHYPEFDNGGEAWCSPTSTAMVLDHFGVGPSRAETAWVDIPGEQDPQVDHAARHTFDYEYDGCGNWPFNTAYAATRGLRGYVTRLRDFNELGRFIEAGVPVVISVSFKKEQLDGAGYGTNGHLMLVVGFDAAGNPVCNDPASHLVHSNDAVRVTYRRDQLEPLWLAKGGTVYLMAPRGHQLPSAPAQANWG